MNIFIYILIGLICGVIGCLIGYFLVAQKIKKINIIELQQQANILSKQNQDIQNEIKEREQICESLNQVELDKQNCIQEYNDVLTTKKQECALIEQDYLHKKELVDLSEQQIKANQEKVDQIYNSQMSLIEEKMDRATENLSQKFSEAEQEYQSEYLQILEDNVAAFQLKLKMATVEYDEQKALLDDLISKTKAAVEANKRAEELKVQKDFYRLVIPKADLIEIATLKEIVPKLRDKEALYKVIYKIYYEKPYTDLIGRVLGSKKITGIYKITEIESQRCYVGQAVDVAQRWKQHIRRGVGADPPTRNKLYPAMMELGVENFTFELIEECSQEKLNEREDYWQDYFQAKEFGYSIK